MPSFQYVARSRASHAVSDGGIDAANPADARSRLIAQGFYVLSLHPVGGDRAVVGTVDPWKVRKRSITSFAVGIVAALSWFLGSYLKGPEVYELPVITLAAIPMAAYCVLGAAGSLIAIRRHQLRLAGGWYAIAGLIAGGLVLAPMALAFILSLWRR